MKTVVSFILLIVSVLTVADLHAQQKDRNGNPIDFAQSSTDHLTKVLSLDGFQSAAIKTFINDYKKEVEALGQLQMPDEARIEKYTLANQKLETRIKEVLNNGQKILYEAEKNKKDKKKKKGKRETADSKTDTTQIRQSQD